MYMVVHQVCWMVKPEAFSKTWFVVCVYYVMLRWEASFCRSLYAARSRQSVSRMRQEGEKKCMCLVWYIIESVPVSAMIKYIRWRIRRWTNYPLYNVEYHWRGIYLRNPVYAMSPTTCLVAPRLRLCILQVRIEETLHSTHGTYFGVS